MRKISLFDTTLRDGEKSLGITLNAKEKLEIGRQLVKLGVDVIEAGFPAASPSELEAVRTLAREVKGAVICAFAGVEEREIDCCADALKGAGQLRIHTGIAISPVYMEKKLRLSPDQVVEMAVAAVRHARKYVGDVQFYAEDAFRSDRTFLVRVLEKVIEAGATVVNIPDTLGYATPWEYSEMISYIMNNVRNIQRAVLSVHCHNDLGMATANSLAGIKALLTVSGNGPGIPPWRRLSWPCTPAGAALESSAGRKPGRLPLPAGWFHGLAACLSPLTRQLWEPMPLQGFLHLSRNMLL